MSIGVALLARLVGQAAADFLEGQPAGLYHMEDLLGP